ncbi:MAG: hypothetical protein WKF71_00135 [Pyrinomonadaceae bacterium]
MPLILKVKPKHRAVIKKIAVAKTALAPMKKQSGENASDSCCSNCCGDACPMKDKQAQAAHVEAQNISVSSSETCEKKHS